MMTDTREIALLSCPFCGGEPERCTNQSVALSMYWVLCRRCHASPGDRETVNAADAAWNTRPTPLPPQSGTIAELREQIINTPETADFMAGVPLEAAHQRERWGAEGGKSPFDWFWLIGYLAQKAADAAVRGDDQKAMHHTISTAAALANWHAALSGRDTAMRPGIATPVDLNDLPLGNALAEPLLSALEKKS